MINDKKVVVVIPARGGSTRLERKNIYPISGKPMIQWVIEECKKSLYIDEIIVSTEDKEIAELSKNLGAKIIKRPKKLADNYTFKQDVIVHAVGRLKSKPDIVISLQANSPEIKKGDLDCAIVKLIKFDRNEIFSVDKKLIQNAAFRIMKYDYVFQKALSTKCGVFVTNSWDIHTIRDVKLVESRGLLSAKKN